MRSAFVPLQNYHMFPRYQTREAYRAAVGAEAPVFTDRRPPKYWLDPAASTMTRNSIAYPNVILVSDRGIAIPGPDGRPQLDLLVLSRDEAGMVNIPPDTSNVPGADVPEVPMPLRSLEIGMVLEFGFAGVIRVRDTSVVADDPPGAFTAADRELLHRIVKALGA